MAIHGQQVCCSYCPNILQLQFVEYVVKRIDCVADFSAPHYSAGGVLPQPFYSILATDGGQLHRRPEHRPKHTIHLLDTDWSRQIKITCNGRTPSYSISTPFDCGQPESSAPTRFFICGNLHKATDWPFRSVQYHSQSSPTTSHHHWIGCTLRGGGT